MSGSRRTTPSRPATRVRAHRAEPSSRGPSPSTNVRPTSASHSAKHRDEIEEHDVVVSDHAVRAILAVRQHCVGASPNDPLVPVLLTTEPLVSQRLDLLVERQLVDPDLSSPTRSVRTALRPCAWASSRRAARTDSSITERPYARALRTGRFPGNESSPAGAEAGRICVAPPTGLEPVTCR